MSLMKKNLSKQTAQFFTYCAPSRPPQLPSRYPSRPCITKRSETTTMSSPSLPTTIRGSGGAEQAEQQEGEMTGKLSKLDEKNNKQQEERNAKDNDDDDKEEKEEELEGRTSVRNPPGRGPQHQQEKVKPLPPVFEWRVVPGPPRDDYHRRGSDRARSPRRHRSRSPRRGASPRRGHRGERRRRRDFSPPRR